MHQIKTELAQFSAAHRLIKGYVGKCQHLHGHDYRVFITFGAMGFDQYDFVVDFGEVKTTCNQWVQDNWDHATLVSSDDEPLLTFVRDNKQKHFVIDGGRNTTVEVLSHELFLTLAPIAENELTKQNPSLQLLEVEIWETQSSCARFGK